MIRNLFSSQVSKKGASFEALMRANGPRIYTLAVRLTGNAVDGEELAHEAFVSAYRHFGRFRGDADFGTWVYRICINLWKNRVRYESRRHFFQHRPLEVVDAEGETTERPLSDPNDRTERPLEIAERQQLVQKALAKLDPDHRAVLVLRDMEDKSYEEIATDLDVPLGTVKSRIARARDEMKQLLKGVFE